MILGRFWEDVWQIFGGRFQTYFWDMFRRRVFFFILCFPCSSYSKTANNRTTGDNNEYNSGPGGPGTGFCGPVGGLVVIEVVASHHCY